MLGVLRRGSGELFENGEKNDERKEKGGMRERLGMSSGSPSSVN